MRGYRDDLTNRPFGQLVALALDPDRGKFGHAYWICRCACGQRKSVAGYALKRGQALSCGCLRTLTVHRTHGQSNSPEYISWSALKKRCLNPDHQDYEKYGGRGITVCERWLSFANFFADMGPRPTPSHSIDRINNDGNYEPGNCRWATKREQGNNRRVCRFIEAFGRRQTLAEWSDETGIDKGTISYRLKKQWPVERALTQRGA